MRKFISRQNYISVNNANSFYNVSFFICSVNLYSETLFSNIVFLIY